jgi:Kdo2-lipid IVA lauroyltransferase/acyltransferase
MNYLVYILVRLLVFAIGSLPRNLALIGISFLAKSVIFILPRYKKIALKNIAQVFPEKSNKEKNDILNDSYLELARLIYDFARIPKLSKEWVEQHIEKPELEVLQKLSRERVRPGIMIATGHLGSFELLAYVSAVNGFPMSFVVRNFPNELLDNWWNSRRNVFGNKVIDRKGAVYSVIEALQKGEDVGILFDQNVKKNHAVFVNFFGRPAATTKTLAMVALRNKAPIMVASLKHKGEDSYKVNCEFCELESVYSDEGMSNDEKVLKITQIVSDVYAGMIRKDPAAWFWFHRRWKTAPEGEREDFYST